MCLILDWKEEQLSLYCVFASAGADQEARESPRGGRGQWSPGRSVQVGRPHAGGGAAGAVPPAEQGGPSLSQGGLVLAGQGYWSCVCGGDAALPLPA